MTAEERLALIRVKIERAKKHICDLQGERKGFLDTKPYVFGAQRYPQTRKPVYYMVSVQDIPGRLGAIAGDVLHNLRSALDHLAYQLVFVGTGGRGPFKHVYFPIFECSKKYEAGKMGKVQGMRPDAIKAIDETKPYKGGTDALWQLHRLDNIDKHRVIIIIGSEFHSMDVSPLLLRMLRGMLPDQTPLPTMPAINLLPENRLFPLKAGDILFTDLPDAEVKQNMPFTFEVAFGEPGILEGDPLLETLQHMTDLVDNLILSFRSLLN